MTQTPHRSTSLPVTLLLFGVAACGHPATHEECVLIFERSAELELATQQIRDPEQVRSRIAALQEAQGEALVGKCVGKRITDDALACVKAAKSPDELEKCLY